MKKTIVAIMIGVLILIFIVVMVTKCDGRGPDVIITHDTVRDTVPIHDTIENVKLVPVEVVEYKPYSVHDTIYETINDERVITKIDTIQTKIPITEYHFDTTLANCNIKGDLTGYDVKLKQLSAQNMQITTTITNTEIRKSKERKKRWGIGIQCGYGIGEHDNGIVASPYIGIGISYNIFRF